MRIITNIKFCYRKLSRNQKSFTRKQAHKVKVLNVRILLIAAISERTPHIEIHIHIEETETKSPKVFSAFNYRRKFQRYKMFVLYETPAGYAIFKVNLLKFKEIS